MKINVAKSAGFCFGVRRAINLALDTARSGKEVCMLGDIVHNEEVVKEIQAAGIHKIKRLCPGKSKIFLVRAHGISIAAENKAKKLGFKIIDATCPMVKEIHKTAKEMEQAGYRIIIIGDKLHDEVIGIAGQLKSKAIVIDGIKSLPVKTLKDIQRAAIVVQSTQNIENVKKIVEVLQKYIKDLKFFNTICAPTRNKQAEIRSMPQKNDVMVIIGSKTSANTKDCMKFLNH